MGVCLSDTQGVMQHRYVCEDARVCECEKEPLCPDEDGSSESLEEVQKQAAPHSLNETLQTGSYHDDDGRCDPKELANASAVLIAMTSAVLIDLMLQLLPPFMEMPLSRPG